MLTTFLLPRRHPSDTIKFPHHRSSLIALLRRPTSAGPSGGLEQKVSPRPNLGSLGWGETKIPETSVILYGVYKELEGENEYI